MGAERRRRRRGRRSRGRETHGTPPRADTSHTRPVRRRAALLLGAVVALVGSACLGAAALRTSTTPLANAASLVHAPSAPHGATTAPTSATREPAHGIDALESDDDALTYAGRDASRRPRYVRRAFTDEERALLRQAFGVADPNRLWLPDSSDGAVLRYDAAGGTAARVGYRSWRRFGETWEEFADRIRALDRRAWPAAARHSYHAGLGALAPAERDEFARLVDAARAAGFRVRVAETYRAPERQAYILAHGNGRTFTATSPHQYGRAADILVGDGRIDHPRKVREWIRFRRWVLAWGEGRYRLVGAASSTWDWPHVELANPPVGFRTVDELLAAARLCLAAPPPADGDDPCALPRDGAALAARLAEVRRSAESVTVVTGIAPRADRTGAGS